MKGQKQLRAHKATQSAPEAAARRAASAAIDIKVFPDQRYDPESG